MCLFARVVFEFLCSRAKTTSFRAITPDLCAYNNSVCMWRVKDDDGTRTNGRDDEAPTGRFVDVIRPPPPTGVVVSAVNPATITKPARTCGGDSVNGPA